MSSNPSPAIAAFLSFLFPGAGQVYAGEARRGLVWAIPMVIFILGAIWLLLSGPNALLGFAERQRFLALLILNVAFFLYHVAAMLDAYSIAQRERSRGFGSSRSGFAPLILAALISLTIVLHGVPGVVGYQASSTLCNVFRCDNEPAPTILPQTTPRPIPSQPPRTPGPTPSFTAEPQDTDEPSDEPTGTPSGSAGPRTPPPTRAPLPPFNAGEWPAWAQDGYLNILLAGTDSRSEDGVDDASLRTDTMLVLSMDIEAGKAALFSFPRNLCNAADGSCGLGTRYPDWLTIPLSSEAIALPANQAQFPSGNYGGMQLGWNYLNALWRYAAINPDKFPGSEGIGAECSEMFECDRAWRALVGTLSEMSGLQFDGIIAVNLKGFSAVVDNLPENCPDDDQRVALTNADCYGGIWIDAPTAIHDDRYHTSQGELIVVDIPAGCGYFDSEMALAFSRSRHESSDYDRARRQSYVLTQVRKQLDPLALLPRIPALLAVAEQNLFLTFQDTDIQWLAQAASRVDADRIYREDLAPGNVNKLGSMQGMRDKFANIFSEPEPEPDPEPSDPGKRCPPRT